MRGVVWRLRWRLAVSRRRLLLWNLLVPIVLLLPVARSPAAAPHRAAVLGVFCFRHSCSSRSEQAPASGIGGHGFPRSRSP
jgi:hypothetical protein